jgi:hypothetical protein
MQLLDQVDALLDVHASNTPGATPFVIYEEPAADFVSYLDFDITSTGWDAVEPGAADGYMFRQGKPGVCIECGCVDDGGTHKQLAKDSIRKFLAYHGAVAGDLTHRRQQRKFQVYKAIVKEDESFTYTKQYEDFEFLPDRTCFAWDKDQKYCVDVDSAIVFATDKGVGEEVGVLGRWLSE